MPRGRPHKCPYCGSTKTLSKGIRRNRSADARIRQCKTCKRRWSKRVIHAVPKLSNETP